ncbi:zinc finger CCHC domain-containing protein 7 [Xyrichtys novacula]|uniref:Zinc finger CCHC domain-containing protein 7 n=1 Tax=Xyrichtys novacula TaxID=13765 RepID=A0AAV1EUG2_XYRNO|nr:zinc finger CCHC domain-containing protein 7 [Xyrichtys novacula]
MNCIYQDREELEDDLYQEDEENSDGSEVNSELEFQLYSQLHYSANAGDIEELEGRGEEADIQGDLQLDVSEKTSDGEQEHTGENRPQSPDASQLQRYLKKREEKRIKQKKVKNSPKGQRSSSLFEEVIVIDSGPDVISISEGDTAEDDEGVCALKGGGRRPLQTSTPAGQGTKKRKQGPNGPVTVDSSSSDSEESESKSKSESESESSESSDSSASSDSDGLENWMILGREKQDGDHSISLNLEGGSNNTDVEEDESWLVSEKDKEAQIYNRDKGARIPVQRLPHRYYTGKSVQCRNCNKTGHLSKNCPEPKKLLPCLLCGTPGHTVSSCPNRHCNNCGLPGHFSDSCSERAYWHKQCHRCSMTGHFFDACPEIWRQYHITTKPGVPVKQHGEDQGKNPAYCYNCSRKGHFGYACTRQRMFNGTYPSTPFINHYDTTEDINRRQHRIKMKIKELKQNGLLPLSIETPLTPGPPKKKQKLSHHKNDHKSYHTPHQSNSNHKPSNSHFYFDDNLDCRATVVKAKKYRFKQQESTSNVKPWKPKRPVPTSRDPPPKLILDEAVDFPRGGGTEKPVQMKKRGKRVKKSKQVPSGPPGGHGHSRVHHLFGTERGEMQGSRQEKGDKKKRRRRNRGKGDNTKNTQMYPTDENLFIIKQRRKRSR